MVHVDVICVKAKFFRAACRENWREGHDKLVRLPEVKPETFQRYIDWTYREALVAEATASDGLRQSVDMYLLGEFLDDIKLRNKTLEAIHRHMIVDLLHPGAAETKLIWEKTQPSSPLRRLVIDATVQRMSSVAFKQHISDWPADLVQQVAVSLKQQATSVTCDDFQANLTTYLEVEGDFRH